MKNKRVFLIVVPIVLLFSTVFGQAPFTTLVKEPRFIKVESEVDDIRKFNAVTDANAVKTFVDGGKSQDGMEKSTKNDIDFFKNNGLTLNLVNKGENRLSLNSQVLHYKLYIANPNDKNEYRINRYNIPLMIITKLSSTYDSIAGSSAADVLDYEAAPITIRIMPSINKIFQTYNDVFYFGFYTDIRGLNLYEPTNNDYHIEFIGSGGIGLTYQGDGQAGAYNSNGEYTPGRYSISVILQGATGKKQVLSSLFDTENNYVGSLQSYFVFKVKEDSPLNIKIGYQYYFQETISGIRSNFSLTLGI